MSAFRVIIVGGGLGGLTLANCLQHANIDFILLEGHKELGIHVGAGVGIDPNGCRILDQLGVLATLESVILPYRRFIFRDSNGKMISQDDSQELTLHR
jgi:2-polyprenyl-6-methoxyphenol hydroxylase-like FAD-dependent oxidoreductase